MFIYIKRIIRKMKKLVRLVNYRGICEWGRGMVMEVASYTFMIRIFYKFDF